MTMKTSSSARNISQLEQALCTGCRSCELSCPKNAIAMQENAEGFLYPAVNAACVQCGICLSRCPVLAPPHGDGIPAQRYAVIYREERTLSASSSGGLFGGIARHVLGTGGVVFGSAYDDDLNVGVVKIESVDDLHRIQGSKYVASDTGTSFSLAKEALDMGKTVLYGGSPCQVAGLRSFLGRPYDNLFTMDLICHGVPSGKLWRKYLCWLGKKHHGKIVYYGFRDKDVAGWSCGGKVKVKVKVKVMRAACDPYYSAFLRCETYRESCYRCPFARRENRVGDITMGDFWGTDFDYPEIPKEQGVSFCSVNTAQGRRLFDLAKDEFAVFECPEEERLEVNVAYSRPSVRPPVRDTIYDGIDEENADRYFAKFRYLRKPEYVMRKIASFVLPERVKVMLRKYVRRG